MNSEELVSAIERIGISERLVVVGDSAEFAWCVEQNKEDGVWEVYYLERGNKNNLQRFADEDQACCYMLGRLTYSQILAGLSWGTGQ